MRTNQSLLRRSKIIVHVETILPDEMHVERAFETILPDEMQMFSRDIICNLE